MKHLIVLFVLFCLTFAQTYQEYSAKFLIIKPSLSGQLTGTIYYSKANLAIRLSYTVGYDELSIYDSSSVNNFFVYKKCSASCDTAPFPPGTVMPNYYKETSDSCATQSINVLYGQCFLCTKSSGTVQSVCVNSANAPVQVTLKDGTVINLQDVTTGVAKALVDPPTLNWGCTLNCQTQADLVWVVDESGSICGTYKPPSNPTCEWALMRAFVMGTTANFDIAPNKINMGLVQFGTGSRYVTPTILSSSADFTKIVTGLTKCRPDGSGCDESQWTFTACGIAFATKLLLDTSGVRALRANAPKVILLATDGYDNAFDQNVIPKNPKGAFLLKERCPAVPAEMANFKSNAEVVAYATSKGIKIVAVGIGNANEINLQYLNDVWASTDTAGKKLSYVASSFDAVASQAVIKEIGRLACSATGSTSPCQGCQGLCTCGSCVCPDKTCEDYDACTVGTCNTTFSYQGGCYFSKIPCDDKDACTIDTCDKVTGCKFTPVVESTYCDDDDPCTIDTCVSSSGCKHIPKDCTNPNPCLVGSKCNSGNGLCSTPNDICLAPNPCVTNCSTPGCNRTAIDCTGGNKCKIQECDAVGGTGCKDVNRVCDDKNNCTADTCNPTDGCHFDAITCNDNDPCTDDSCDPKLGCQYATFNETERCFGGDICKVYFCDKALGCTSKPRICENIFNDSCIEPYCDSTSGCLYRPTTCENKGGDPNCFITYCNSSRDGDKCYAEEVDSCVLARILGGTGAAVLGIGAIIAIVAACIVFAGGATTVAVIGFTKGFSGEFENKNPIFEKGTVEGSNPAFNRDSVFNTPPVKPS